MKFASNLISFLVSKGFNSLQQLPHCVQSISCDISWYKPRTILSILWSSSNFRNERNLQFFSSFCSDSNFIFFKSSSKNIWYLVSWICLLIQMLRANPIPCILDYPVKPDDDSIIFWNRNLFWQRLNHLDDLFFYSSHTSSHSLYATLCCCGYKTQLPLDFLKHCIPGSSILQFKTRPALSLESVDFCRKLWSNLLSNPSNLPLEKGGG